MECGGCTSCCFAYAVVELDKPSLTECEYADKGCSIYRVRPDSCRDCYCAWITQPKVAIELRPDKCGVVFEKIDDKTILATLLSKPTKEAVGQKRNFEKQGYKVVTNDCTQLYRRFN